MTELEKTIMNVARNSITDAIKKELTGYNKPLNNIVKIVIENNEDELRNIFKRGMTEILKDPSFEKEVNDAFRHKLARTMVSQLEGTVDKAVNAIKNDPTIKSRMIIAIENIIEESNE